MLRLLGALIAPSIAALGLAGCGGGTPPPPDQGGAATRSPGRSEGASPSERAQQAVVDAMKPRRAGRPVVAVLALNEGTEMTDLLLPQAVLQRADVADVQVVAPRGGSVALYPALQVEGAQSLPDFDGIRPSGADYVIVPAMRTDDNPAVTAWLRQQASKGARVIGICAGALVVGRAGLLDGRHFTSHWYYRDKVLDRHPGTTYVPNQRYVVDRGVVTTTGITASMPAMLALVEAIGGRQKAQALAAELGVASWSPEHDSARFHLDASRRWDYVATKAAFWRHERWGVDVRDGSDDIALAMAADAWSRTGRVSVEASAARPVTLRSGLLLSAQPVDGGTPRLPMAPALKPMQQLDRTLCQIAERYGASRRDWVMQEMEYAGVIACER